MALESAPLLLSPYVLAIFQRSTITFLIAFTHPTSILRPAIFLIVLTWNFYLLSHFGDYITNTTWKAYLGGETLTGLMRYAEQVLVQRWSFESYDFFQLKDSKDKHKPKVKNDVNSPSPESAPDTFWNRLRFGAWVCFSDRYVASSHQAANTPNYSDDDPTYCPSRLSFILRRIGIVAFSYMLLDSVQHSNQPELNPILFADDKIPLLSRLWAGQATAEEVSTTIGTVLGFGFVAYWGFQMPLLVCQIFVVALGLSRPELERPLFGSLRDAYTLRGFWGSFWHQFLRRRFTTLSNFVTYQVLRFPRPNSTSRSSTASSRAQSQLTRVLTRYTHLLICFLISGAYHWALDVATGLSWSESGAPRVFTLMAVGIVLEDMAQWLWYDLSTSRIDSRTQEPGARQDHTHARKGTWTTMAVGYLWVVLWLSLVVPYLIYPVLSRNKGEDKDMVIPLSVIGYFKGS